MEAACCSILRSSAGFSTEDTGVGVEGGGARLLLLVEILPKLQVQYCRTVVTCNRDSVPIRTYKMLVILLKFAGSFVVAVVASILGNLVTGEIERYR